jgi:hypothetical protein
MPSYPRRDLGLLVGTALAYARVALWFLMRGMVAAGSSWCPAGEARRRAMRYPAPPPRVADEVAIQRDVARGMRAIDAYVRIHAHP